MFPTIPLPIFNIPLHTFGLFLVIAIVCFGYMLQKMCKKVSINPNFFLGSALTFVLSTFLVSRLVFVLLEWRDYQYIVQDSFLNFFVMSDYNMSLMGGIIGFL
jgi:prolipoprotein diacylglyceryltransferase